MLYAKEDTGWLNWWLCRNDKREVAICPPKWTWHPEGWKR